MTILVPAAGLGRAAAGEGRRGGEKGRKVGEAQGVEAVHTGNTIARPRPLMGRGYGKGWRHT